MCGRRERRTDVGPRRATEKDGDARGERTPRSRDRRTTREHVARILAGPEPLRFKDASMTREHFLAASAAVAAATSSPLPARGGGARSGSYCLPLHKGAGDLSFDFQLETLDSDAIFALSEHLGHPVWVNFFASWCGPCNREMPDVTSIAAAYADKGLRVFGIDVEEHEDKVRAFRKQYEIAFPILLDRTSSVFHTFGLHGIPSHIFFAPDHTITCMVQDSLEPREMENEIAVALARVTSDKTTPNPA